MSPRKERRRRRGWRSSWGRRMALFVGWLALFGAVAGLVVFAVMGRIEALGAGSGAAVVAVVLSGLLPEPTPRNRAVRFAPLESVRNAGRGPSLARQLLTLP